MPCINVFLMFDLGVTISYPPVAHVLSCVGCLMGAKNSCLHSHIAPTPCCCYPREHIWVPSHSWLRTSTFYLVQNWTLSTFNPLNLCACG